MGAKNKQETGIWGGTKRYHALKWHWIDRFGAPVYKLPIDAGFTCPNRDGTVATGGCAYCDGRGSLLRLAGPLPSVTEQIRRGKAHYRQARRAEKFLAYFQTCTNTYGPVEKLRRLFDEALADPDVVGLSVGTRPDCVPEEVLALLQGYAGARHIWLELGLQSIHDRTLSAINRGHDAACFFDAVHRAAGRGLYLCVHIIVGLPGETRADVLATAETLARLPLQGIKIHALLALRGTALGDRVASGEVVLWSREAYVAAVADILEVLPPEMVIQRLTADGYRDIFLGPSWAGNKMAVLNAIDRELESRGTWQGARARGGS